MVSVIWLWLGGVGSEAGAVVILCCRRGENDSSRFFNGHNKGEVHHAKTLPN